MKKVIAVSSIILLLFTGCNSHLGEKLGEYGPAKWVSDNPDVWFNVLQSDIDSAGNSIFVKGQIVTNGKVIDFVLSFDMAVTAHFENETGNLFYGSCEFSENEFTVRINKKSDTVFNGKVDRIVFVKEALDSSQ